MQYLHETRSFLFFLYPLQLLPFKKNSCPIINKGLATITII